jgi:hypothetical protein
MPTQKNICKYLVIKEETNILGDVFPQLTSPSYLPTSSILPCTKSTTHYPRTHADLSTHLPKSTYYLTSTCLTIHPKQLIMFSLTYLPTYLITTRLPTYLIVHHSNLT